LDLQNEPVQLEISDFGFEMGFRPISKFPPRRNAGCFKYVDIFFLNGRRSKLDREAI